MLKTILKMAEDLVHLSCLYAELNERVSKLEVPKELEQEENQDEVKFQKGLDSILNYSVGKVNEDE